MSYREANLRTLTEHHPVAADALREILPADAEVHVIATPSGAPTVVRGGLSFHSRHDPRAEADRLVTGNVDGTATALIVLGFGLGYATEAARRRFAELPILVLEPDALMFQAALESRDLTRLLSDPRISFLVAAKPQEVAAPLASLPLAKPAFLRLRPAMESNAAWFRAADEVVQSWLLRKEINLNTLTRFGRLWVRNLTSNLHALLRAPGISRLAGLCRGLPAVVIAGGPSLDALLPSLRSARERVVVISVNTPLRRCLEAGVLPDFVVVVDPQYWVSRFMDWAQLPSPGGRIVVAEPSTHPRVLRAARSPNEALYLCSSLFPLGETLEEAIGQKGKLGAGGSVATAAWDLARLLGASPIYMAGLDLGYPGMRTHCRGIFTEELWLSSSDRSRPQETGSFRSVHEIGLFPARSASGGTTPTDRRMLLYTWWFESQLAMHPEAQTFTLSRDSVAIPGMPLADVSGLLDLPVRRSQIESRIRRERREVSRETPPAERAMALRGALAELLTGLDELEKLSYRALKANEALDTMSAAPGTVRRLLSELDSIDGRILAISHRSIAGFLMQSLIHRMEAKGDTKVSREEAIADSRDLYSGILESARWQKGLIGRALDSLE